jgi:antitoxin component YwqK of YwqJK toxin-antitoxin module
MTADLNIGEIPYENGEIRFRYSRVMAPDGKRWMRHGLFREYARNGQVISEGTYKDGREHGQWRDFYEDGQLAAEGHYADGREIGEWRYWDREGKPTDTPTERNC